MQPDELRVIRKGLGFTQDQMGSAIGLSRKAINEMEAGKAPIERRTALAVRYLAEHPDAAES